MLKKLFLLAVLLSLLCIGWSYKHVFLDSAFPGSNVEKFDLVIPSDSISLSKVVDSLLLNGFEPGIFWNLLSSQMSYTDNNIKSGLYEIKTSSNRIDLIRHLRSGKQKPVMITFNSLRKIDQLSGKITRNLEIDSASYYHHLDGLNEDNQITLTYFIPDSYETYFNISAEGLTQKMKTESNRFWSQASIKGQLEKLGMTQNEVYTLASIVEQESRLDKEKPIIASVYLNRLRRGMKLQADPTVVFANNDFNIRRVLNKHLAFDSPYNTYMYAGLPPAPICMPSKSSINAVLNPKETKYIFFCAKPGYQSEHAFASNLRQHMNNARVYQKWLSQQGIR